MKDCGRRNKKKVWLCSLTISCWSFVCTRSSTLCSMYCCFYGWNPIMFSKSSANVNATLFMIIGNHLDIWNIGLLEIRPWNPKKPLGFSKKWSHWTESRQRLQNNCENQGPVVVAIFCKCTNPLIHCKRPFLSHKLLSFGQHVIA